jgi:5-methylcytosine-specific restriction endonuclease McrA
VTAQALPPLPPGDYSRTGPKRGADIPFWRAPEGYCRWCGEDIGARLRNGDVDTRARWHGACVTAYQAYFPRVQRERIWQRELGECQGCHRFTPRREARRIDSPERLWARHNDTTHYRRWAVDHITPLWDGGANEDPNLQLLCDPCHKAKTAAEAALRAEKRRVLEPAPPETPSDQAPLWEAS